MQALTHTSRRPIVVIKVGGSLLERADLRDLLQAIAQQRSDCAVLWVIGGGAAADVVRRWDAVHHLGDEVAHWLAIEAMGLNESLLLQLLPGSRLVRSGPQLQRAWDDGVPPVVCAGCFVKWAEAQGEPALPRSWDVTSDSLAAWIAAGLRAEELLLLKSTPLPVGICVDEASATGLVDAWFPRVAPGVSRVNWVDADEVPVVIRSWTTGPGEPLR